MALLFFVTPDYALQVVGLSDGSHFMSRMCYPFFHANIFHLLINSYALLSIFFLSNPKPTDVIVSAAIAVLIPSSLLSGIPVVGMSVFIFAMTGVLVARAKEWVSFFLFNLLVIICGAMIARIAFVVHLYGFVSGMVYGLITAKRYGGF